MGGGERSPIIIAQKGRGSPPPSAEQGGPQNNRPAETNKKREPKDLYTLFRTEPFKKFLLGRGASSYSSCQIGQKPTEGFVLFTHIMGGAMVLFNSSENIEVTVYEDGAVMLDHITLECGRFGGSGLFVGDSDGNGIVKEGNVVKGTVEVGKQEEYDKVLKWLNEFADHPEKQKTQICGPCGTSL